jgi:hypothetical protein
MPKALQAANKALGQAQKQFLTLCKRSAKTLTRERDSLARRARSARARNKRALVQLQAKAVRLSKTTSKKAAKVLKKKIADLQNLRVEARAEAKDIRGHLAKVRVDLVSARQHLSRALHTDKALAAFERQFAKVAKRVAARAAK